MKIEYINHSNDSIFLMLSHNEIIDKITLKDTINFTDNYLAGARMDLSVGKYNNTLLDNTFKDDSSSVKLVSIWKNNYIKKNKVKKKWMNMASKNIEDRFNRLLFLPPHHSYINYFAISDVALDKGFVYRVGLEVRADSPYSENKEVLKMIELSRETYLFPDKMGSYKYLRIKKGISSNQILIDKR
jgi:hypothetical protein